MKEDIGTFFFFNIVFYLRVSWDFVYALRCFSYITNLFQRTKRCFQEIVSLISFSTCSKIINASKQQFAIALKDNGPQLFHVFHKPLFCVHSCETRDVVLWSQKEKNKQFLSLKTLYSKCYKGIHKSEC